MTEVKDKQKGKGIVIAGVVVVGIILAVGQATGKREAEPEQKTYEERCAEQFGQGTDAAERCKYELAARDLQTMEDGFQRDMRRVQ